MRRLVAAAAIAAACSACAIGPRYQRPAADVPHDWRAPTTLEDSLRHFFDSLGTVRDSAGAIVRSRAPGGPTISDTGANLGWFGLLQDTVLQHLTETAVRENRDVRTAIATIAEYRALYGVARGALFPQIGVSAQAGREQIAFGTTKIPAFDLYSLTGNLQWELDFWGRLRRGTEAARADLLATEASRRAVVLSLVSDVATAYLELRELDRDLDISERTLASRRQTLRLAQERFRQGLISELDVRQFEAQVADPAARVADFERQVEQKENQLSVLLGRHPAAIPRGRPLDSVVAAIAIPAELPSSLLERRPDVRQAEAAVRAATARIGLAEGALLPRFTITGQYGRQSTGTSSLLEQRNEIYQIFGGVSLPLFTGGQLTNEVRAARARAAQSRFRFQQTVLTALQEVEDQLVALRTTRDQLSAQQLQVDALRRALELATRRYESGIASYLDVLDVQRSLFTAELSLAQAQRQELVAAVQLYKALGGGWPVAGDTSGYRGEPPR